jgi:nitroimidazol reductase NimA-like FMN-containing flavoprotein (pyridoxamine 5'-phosphate oxidase superfamily)
MPDDQSEAMTSGSMPGEADRTPGGREERHLHVLDETECYTRLKAQSVGRIGVVDTDGIVIVPVNYVVDDDDIVLRTSPYGLLGLGSPQRAALEIDQVDNAHHHGWSVLVRGTLSVVDPDEAIEIAARTKLETWPSGMRTMTVRLHPKSVTGRSL